MKFTLTDYQDEATTQVMQWLDTASVLLEKHGARSAVGLTAPTGAGKTVIATAVLERLMFGGGIQSPNKNLTVLWLTDDPSLNEQSREKILQASSLIQPHQIEMIDAGFDQETFTPGTINFINIGKLTNGATGHVATGDNRRWSLWETIGNTVARRNRDFLFVVDEAHRGSEVKPGTKKTIMRTVLDGGPVEFPDGAGNVKRIVNESVGIMLGISATPKKFDQAMADTAERTPFKVAADTAKVRESGMIKDLINVNHPTDNQPTDDTLVRVAVQDLIAYTALWEKERVASGGAHAVNPLLVVQVPDKTTDVTLGQLIDSMAAEWPDLLAAKTGQAVIAHSFGDKKHRTMNDGRMVPYMAPQLIQENQHIRVVLFKAALTTGWDCPRAEVMVSLRPAKEYTSIAQLIGRMVRTPVAGRIETEGLEELNSVSLYLPHYDADEVAQVVGAFVGDADIETAVSVNPVEFARTPGIPEALWDIELPKEIKPKRTFASETARLAALGTRLDLLGIHNPFNPTLNLTQEVEARVKAVLLAEYARLGTGIDLAAANLLEVTYDKVGYDQYTGKSAITTALTVRTSATNLRELKRKAEARMPDASGHWLYAALYELLDDHEEAVVRLSALSTHDEVIQALESSASNLIDSWRRDFQSPASRLPVAERVTLDEIWHPHGEPTIGAFALPGSVKARTQRVVNIDGKPALEDLELHQGHLYSAGGSFPMKATSWERDVIAKEITQPGFIGWYRNPASTAGLSVSYTEGGVEKSLYPDFLFFFQTDAGVVVDIVDPHNHALGDTPGKWSALARFARQHPGAFRRVTAVIRNDADGPLQALELSGRANTVVEDRVATCSGKEDIAAVFAEYGGTY